MLYNSEIQISFIYCLSPWEINQITIHINRQGDYNIQSIFSLLSELIYHNSQVLKNIFKLSTIHYLGFYFLSIPIPLQCFFKIRGKSTIAPLTIQYLGGKKGINTIYWTKWPDKRKGKRTSVYSFYSSEYFCQTELSTIFKTAEKASEIQVYFLSCTAGSRSIGFFFLQYCIARSKGNTKKYVWSNISIR